MLNLRPEDLNERNNYKVMSSIVVPRPIGFITTLNHNGTINGAPFSFFNIISTKPSIIGVTVLRNNGKMKDTARNILREKEFVCHITTEDNIDKINLTSKILKVNESEIDFAKLTLKNSSLIKTKGILEANIKMEVKLINHLTFNDENNNISSDFFIGKVLLYSINKNILNDTYIDYDKLKPIGRLAGNLFLTKNGFKEIIRPK